MSEPDYDLGLHNTMDAALMLGWFANAIMAGYDAAKGEYERAARHGR